MNDKYVPRQSSTTMYKEFAENNFFRTTKGGILIMQFVDEIVGEIECSNKPVESEDSLPVTMSKFPVRNKNIYPVNKESHRIYAISLCTAFIIVQV